MSNNLTHGIAGSVLMAAVNAVFGLPILGLNIFIAGILAMLINLDRIGGASGKRSPIGHSVASAAAFVYLAYCAMHVAQMFGLMGPETAGAILLAVVCGYSSHLALDAVSGEGIYLLPTSRKSSKCWNNWLRISMGGVSRISDSKANMAFGAVLVVLIALV